MQRLARQRLRLVSLVLQGLVLTAPALLAQEAGSGELPAGQSEVDPIAGLANAMARAEEGLSHNEMEAAESDFRRALLEGWLLLGALEAAEGELELAAEAFDHAAVSAVETRRAYTLRALVALRQGHAEQAIGLLRKVLLQDPGSGHARRLLAQALIAAGRPGEAVQELEEARISDPQDLETTFTLGNGYLRVGKVAEAEQLLEQLAEARPIPQTHVLIGRTYRDFQHYDRSRRALQRALEMDQSVRRARYYLGTIELLSLGRDGLEEAMRLFESELELYPDDPMTNLYLGLALSEDRRFEAAIPALERAAAWDPTRLDALRFLGRCRLGLDQLEEAEAVLREALELGRSGASDRQLSRIHYQLALTLRRLGASAEAEDHFEAARVSSGDLVDAERDRFQRFLADSVDLDAPAIAADTLIEVSRLGGLPPGARRGLRQQVKSALARSYFNLGTMLARSGQFERAVGLFESATWVDSEFPGLQRALGVAAFNARRFETAADSLASAVEREPGDLDLRRMLALAWLNLGAYDRAALLLEDDSLRESEPGLEYAYALALVRSGAAESAQPIFDRLVIEHADWPELHVLLGQAYAQQEDFERAIVSLRRALELNAAVTDANSTLGEIYMRQGRLDEAETVLHAELARRPEHSQSRYLLAVVLDLANRSGEAVEQLQVVLSAQPDNADARYLMGKIRLATGAAEEAAIHLEAAVTLAPEDANIRYQLAQALQRMGERDKAAEQFEIYRRLKDAGRGGDS